VLADSLQFTNLRVCFCLKVYHPPAGIAGENIPKALVLALGQDVTAIAQPGVDPAQLPIGSFVGVKRSNGCVTVARLTAPAPETPPGQFHVTLDESGAWKDVTPDMLYTVPVLAKVEGMACVSA
jgi:hypothetical protein